MARQTSSLWKLAAKFFLFTHAECDDLHGSMKDSKELPAPYIPPPPTLPVVQAVASPPPVKVQEEAPKVTAPPEEPDEEISPDAELSEWIISILKDAIAYPTRKHGWAILIPGALMIIAMPIVALMPILGFVAFLLILGYLCAYYLDIIGTSTNGDTALPDWPSVSNLAEDVFWPSLKILAVCLISCLPLILYGFTRENYSTEGIIGSLLYFLSAAYLPMACIALVMTDSVISALPHRVLPAIKRCLPEYLVPVVVLILIKVISMLVEGLTSLILPAFLSAMLTGLITFYTLIIQARITGLTCQRFRDRIEWG
jgi:hypothetical protein